MKITKYKSASAFLRGTKTLLERAEERNNLMLGVCLRLKKDPRAYKSDPFLATVENGKKVVLIAVRTPPYKVQINCPDHRFSRAFSLLAENLMKIYGKLPGAVGVKREVDIFTAAWRRLYSFKVKTHMNLRIYKLTRVNKIKDRPGYFRQAKMRDVKLIGRWIRGWQRAAGARSTLPAATRAARKEVQRGDLYLWVDRVPVSLAGKCRPTPHGSGITRVYTPPRYRNRGYATACVASVCREVLSSGKEFCALFADKHNPVSNYVYRKIGFKPVCAFVDYSYIYKK